MIKCLPPEFKTQHEQIKKKKYRTRNIGYFKKGYYSSPLGMQVNFKEIQDFAVSRTKLYSPKQSDALLAKRILSNTFQTEIEVSEDTTLDAVRKLIKEGHSDVVCLNFASAKNPGGGFLGGSQAQEESIARATGLYPCLLKANEYYTVNRNTQSCFYTDYMIYSPNVPIFKNEAGKLLPNLDLTGVITAPAVNTGAVVRNEEDKIAQVETVMRRRIEKVLAIALENKNFSIVLGAWGCGVFQNDPNEIARFFKEIITHKFPNDFRKIVFAVYSNNDRFIKPFYKEFDVSK